MVVILLEMQVIIDIYIVVIMELYLLILIQEHGCMILIIIVYIIKEIIILHIIFDIIMVPGLQQLTLIKLQNYILQQE